MEVSREELARRVDDHRHELLEALHLTPRQLQARTSGSKAFNASELLVIAVATGLRFADLIELSLDGVEEIFARGPQCTN